METADIVVIGGGVLGGAVAYYLAKQKAGRVIVLERHTVAQGNSSLAAGLLTRGRFKPHLIPMALETYQAIDEIESTTGENLNVHRTGCLYAAVTPIYQKEICELVSVSSKMGLKTEWFDLIDAPQLVPWLKLPRGTQVAFMPEDGHVDGYTLASGYLKTAKKLGVEIREQTEVRSISKEGQRINGVKTNQGDFSSSVVIDAAGVWAGLLADELGIGFPMAPVRSHYWITEEHPLFSPRQPFVILPDARAYARPEAQRLLFGFREAHSVALDSRELPENMNGYIFKKDPYGWESLLEGIPEFSKYFPLIEEIEIPTYIKGLSNYTPDGNFVLGAFPALEGFIAATGCAGAGIAMSGGIGRLVSELTTDRPPFVDPAPHRIERFGKIDPYDPDFLQRCADARSGKITG